MPVFAKPARLEGWPDWLQPSTDAPDVTAFDASGALAAPAISLMKDASGISKGMRAIELARQKRPPWLEPVIDELRRRYPRTLAHVQEITTLDPPMSEGRTVWGTTLIPETGERIPLVRMNPQMEGNPDKQFMVGSHELTHVGQWLRDPEEILDKYKKAKETFGAWLNPYEVRARLSGLKALGRRLVENKQVPPTSIKDLSRAAQVVEAWLEPGENFADRQVEVLKNVLLNNSRFLQK